MKGILILFLTFAPATSYGQFLGFGSPNSYESCAESAAKQAKNRDSLRILLRQCEVKFPGRLADDGRYYYWDDETKSKIEVSGSRLNAKDISKIEEHRNEYRQLVSELKLRNEQAAKSVSVKSWTLTCENPYFCGSKIINARVENRSSFTVRYIELGGFISGAGQKCTTNTVYSRIYSANVNIPAGSVSQISFVTRQGPDSGSLSGCLAVNAVQVWD